MRTRGGGLSFLYICNPATCRQWPFVVLWPSAGSHNAIQSVAVDARYGGAFVRGAEAPLQDKASEGCGFATRQVRGFVAAWAQH